jgi:hypothetical protein
MKTPLRSLIAIGAACLLLSGCGGNNNGTGPGTSGAYNGIYRVALTRGTSAVTVYVNYPEVEAVVTDEAGVFASYQGSSTTASSLVNGDIQFSAITLNGSDGETASITGFETPGTNGAAPTLNLTIVGGIGFNGAAPQVTTTSNSLLVGTYSGPFTSNYSSLAGGAAATEPVGSISSMTITADSTTGGYDLSATGSTEDPTGAAVTFAINDAQVDPCGVITPGFTVTYTYTSGSPSPITNTFTTGYINLGVVATTTLVGLFQSTSTGWTGSPVETDTMVLTQASAAAKAKKK